MKLIHEIRVRAFFLVALVGLVCFGSLAYGQGTSATLTGNVTDQNGAAISGASVVLKNVDTGLALQTQTDKVGTYMFNTVPAGNYELTINAAGFVKYAQTGIILNANLNATQNVHLTVGSAKDETIKVTANAELIDTTTAELGMTINEEAVSELPFINRDPSAVALLAPGMLDGNKAGVAWQQAGFSFPNESVASSNGGRVGSTFYMLDGVSNMDTYLGSNSPTPNSDATQEFRLISNNFSAIYGFSTGGVVSMATRSGTNSWHGGLFEFMRNTDFDSGDWVTHVRSTYRRNQFGGYVGGPALKDKLFFFFNYQRTDLVGGPGSAANGTSTPTTQMMNGDFSGLIDYAQANNTDCGSGYNVPVAEQNTHCGWLLGPFQTVNGIPNQVVGGAAALDPIAIQFTNDGLPGHTAPASGTGNGTATVQNLAGGMLYASANLGNDIWNEYTGRVDYDVTPSQRLTLRSFIDKFIQPAGDTPGDVLSVINMNGWSQTFGEQMWYFNELAQHTWTMNPSTVNTFTGFWTQQSSHNGTPVLDHQGKPMCWSRYIKTITEPTCGMEGAYFGSSNGGWTEPSNEVRGTIGFSDTLIKTLGRHTLSAGIDLVHQRAVENAINYPADAIIDFGGYTNFGNNAASGSGIADWLLGYMSGFEQGAGELADIQGWLIDPYVNDEFRLKPGLTLTLGLRWDPDFAPVSVGGRGTAFVAGQQSIIYPAAPTGLIFPGDANMNAGLRPSDTAYFEPRLGVAYQPKFLPHTSFHAAFGMFTAPVAYSDYNHVVDMAPFSPAFSPANPSNTPICSNTVGGPVVACVANSGQILTGYSNFDNPWSTPSFNTPNGNPFGTGPGQIPWANPNYKPPTNSTIPGPVYEQDSFARSFKQGMTQAWNASVEQQINGVTAVRVAYVGSESYHQSYVIDRNAQSYTYCTFYNNANCPLPTQANLTNGSLKLATFPFPAFTQILEYDSGATASYHSLQVTAQRHLSHGLQAQSSFTWQKTLDVSSFADIAGETNGMTNPLNLRWSRGPSSANIPFTWTSNFVYRSPELKGQNYLVREAIGGWELSPIMTWQSGTPFGVGAGSSTVYGELGKGDGCFKGCSGDRADRVPGVPLKVRQGGRSNWTKNYFNELAFTSAHDGTFGNSQRNLLQGPPGFNTDASLMKNWSFFGKYQLQMRMELYNAFNHAIMSNPGANPADGNASATAQIQNNGSNRGGFGNPNNTVRIGQAALKLTF